MSILFIMVVAGGLLAALLLYGAVTRSRWGINLTGATCPNCGLAMPRVRTPADAEEAAWGGWTCSQCGTKVDKWGRGKP